MRSIALVLIVTFFVSLFAGALATHLGASNLWLGVIVFAIYTIAVGIVDWCILLSAARQHADSDVDNHVSER